MPVTHTHTHARERLALQMEIPLSRRIFRRATAERCARCLVELRLITTARKQ